MSFDRPRIRLFCAGLVLGSLAACASVTPYQPVGKNGGYSEQRLETNRYRIRFTGSSATPRETVENYLMYRAAEVTLQNGYDYFVVTGQDTEADPQRSYRSGSSVGVGVGSGGHGGFGFGGISIGLPLGGDGESYNAQMDILVYKGAKPADNGRAFAAREVKANLEGVIQRPKPKA